MPLKSLIEVNKLFYHKPYDEEKAERAEAEKWKQIREELGIENEKDK